MKVYRVRAGPYWLTYDKEERAVSWHEDKAAATWWRRRGGAVNMLEWLAMQPRKMPEHYKTCKIECEDQQAPETPPGD